MIGLTLVSFLAGILTVLAPCVLPLLPVIVGRSMSEKTSSYRLLVVTFSLGASVFLFTILLKVSTAFISIPLVVWQIISGGLLVLFGLVTLVPSLWDHVPGVQALYRRSNALLGTGYKQQSLWGDVLMGAALGPVFSSCSPTYFVILAAVLPTHFATGVWYLVVYSVGLSLSLFLIALLGQKAALKLGALTDTNSIFRKVVGVLFVIIGIAVIFGLDKKLESALPGSAFGEIGLEQKLLSPTPDNNPVATSTPASSVKLLTPAEKLVMYQKAPELAGIAGYVNTDGKPITLESLRGKVVLIDFWDYSCINCQRTFPYLKAWYDKYKDQGLVIIGVHTPEFAFEQIQSNVEDAARRFGLVYPIVLDNHYDTWNAFKNQYWPREYLIDMDGYIVHDHAGEGEYDETEQAIQAALAERAARLGTGTVATSTVSVAPADLSGIHSPETYFGAARNEYLGNGKQGVQGMQTLVVPNTISPNTLYLGGTWNFLNEYAEAQAGATAVFEYGSHDVYIVATNPREPVRIKVYRDGAPVGAYAGADVDPKTSEAVISGDRLYKLVHDPAVDVHIIKIEIESGTLDAYTFTFG